MIVLHPVTDELCSALRLKFDENVTNVYNLLVGVDDWRSFSNKGVHPVFDDSAPTAATNSLEAIHDSIHMWIGGPIEEDKKTGDIVLWPGHMGNQSYAGVSLALILALPQE